MSGSIPTTNVVDLAAIRPARARGQEPAQEPAREPDEAFVRSDADGFSLYLFVAEYSADAIGCELELWAHDADHAKRQIAAMQASLKPPVQAISRDERQPTLERRLAECLRDCVDTPLMVVTEPGSGGRMLELGLGAFAPELNRKAAELLEEAGL